MKLISKAAAAAALMSVAGLPLAAQTPAPAARAAASPSTGVQAMKGTWQGVTRFIVMAAEEMPEADYAFRPTPEVRTFGQLIGHVAGAQYLICAAALRDAPRQEDDIEKSQTTKAGLVTALKASIEYCNKAYAQSDAEVAGDTQLFGQTQTRMYALGLNAVHNGEHYGNIVTYLRIKGMVPPSSRPNR